MKTVANHRLSEEPDPAKNPTGTPVHSRSYREISGPIFTVRVKIYTIFTQHLHNSFPSKNRAYPLVFRGMREKIQKLTTRKNLHFYTMATPR